MYKSLNEFEIRPDATTGFDGNHRVIMGKMLCNSSAFIFDRIFFILAGNEDIHNISDELKFGQIGPRTAELAALERLEKSP